MPVKVKRRKRNGWRISQTAFVFVLAAAAITRVLAGASHAADQRPRVFVLDATSLAQVKNRLDSGDASLNPAFNRLLRDADRSLTSGTPSVVGKEVTPPSGDKHDYMSLAPYWWPNPNTPGGMPYVHLDGKINPERDKIPDRKNLESLIAAAKSLALAYFFSERDEYAAQLAKMLRVWFLDDATKMNPHLRYAQAVPGRNQGSVSGLIESHNLPELIDAVALVAGSKAWSQKDQRELQDWLRSFLNWLQESDQGRAESKAQNNHGSWYDVQVASFALFVGNEELARKTIGEMPAKRIARQIEPDGSQPLELKRTRPWNYSLFNLEALFQGAALAEKLGIDLWNFSTPDGRGIRKALDWLVPFATGDRKWSYREISDEQPARIFPLLKRAAVRYRDPAHAAAINKLPDVTPDRREHLLYPAVGR
ncbi:MAG TPA: alginate lyase family protein [Candidatus Binatia bacterium]|nr:alginate lyase family protein [Candidatus Binatia bacterium]